MSKRAVLVMSMVPAMLLAPVVSQSITAPWKKSAFISVT